MKLSYPGTELELFATAINWKRYVTALVAPHIRETVLDVGAGIGAHVPFLFQHHIRDWVCIEPDEALASRLVRRIAYGELPTACRWFVAAVLYSGRSLIIRYSLFPFYARSLERFRFTF